MDSEAKIFLKVTALSLVAVLLLGSVMFVACNHDHHRDIDTDITLDPNSDHPKLVLDADYAAFRFAGYEYGDQMKVKVGDRDPIIALFCGDKNDVGYLEAYITEDAKTGSMVLGQMFGGIGSDYAGSAHISFLKHIDRLDSLESYGSKIPYRDASSDAQFCNFRNVTAGGILPGLIYRSVDPLGENHDGRTFYADQFARHVGIRHEINLCEDAEQIRGKFSVPPECDYCYNLYKNGDVFFDPMSPSLFTNTEEFKDCFKYILDNDGPFLVHCMEGKDRTGMFFILLEGMCGASIEEVKADYMQTMVNFYNIVPGSNEYKTVEKMMCDRIIYLIAHPEDFGKCLAIDWEEIDVSGIDIRSACDSYLEDQCGLLHDQVDSLVQKMTGRLA